jgi:hypothetical protein
MSRLGTIYSAGMYPDHDWLDEDFASTAHSAEEEDERPRHMTAADFKQRQFERLYERFLRRSDVGAMRPVESLQVFLTLYPQFRIPPRSQHTRGSGNGMV